MGETVRRRRVAPSGTAASRRLNLAYDDDEQKKDDGGGEMRDQDGARWNRENVLRRSSMHPIRGGGQTRPYSHQLASQLDSFEPESNLLCPLTYSGCSAPEYNHHRNTHHHHAPMTFEKPKEQIRGEEARTSVLGAWRSLKATHVPPDTPRHALAMPCSQGKPSKHRERGDGGGTGMWGHRRWRSSMLP